MDKVNLKKSSNHIDVKSFFKAFGSKESWRHFGAKTMSSLSKLSKTFLLPISLLPIAGIFLGAGANIAAIDGASAGVVLFGNLLKTMGDTAFANLPVLFLLSATLAYTNDIATSLLASLVGFLVFNAIISVFMSVNEFNFNYVVDYVTTGGKSGTIVWTGGVGESILDKEVLFNNIIDKYKEIDFDRNKFVINEIPKVIVNYDLLFWKKIPTPLFTSSLGIKTLNTGVFAGIIVGLFVAWIYNKTYKIQLPKLVSFFSGVRFVPILLFFLVIPLSFMFMIIWPPIGKGLAWFGEKSGKIPYGGSSFIYEVIERSLIPFGLHHVFYAPLWWTSAGGGPISDFRDEILSHGFSSSKFAQLTPRTLSAVGDQYLVYAVLADKNIDFTDLSPNLFSGETWNIVNIGRFQNGKFPFMMFGLPMACLAMYLASPKENRGGVLGIYASAAGTTFLTGITEPIEFSFLFVAPWLFYGIHMPLATISFWLCGLFKVHVGQTVSGGFIDFLVFGVAPTFYGKTTNFYWILVFGPFFSVAYFFVFYFLIKRFDVKTPGRDGAVTSDTKLYTKKDYKAKKSSSKVNVTKKDDLLTNRILTIIKGLGTRENIESVDACAARLRVTIKDKSKVDVALIKSTKAVAVFFPGKHQCHCIYGTEADFVKTKINSFLEEGIDLKNNKSSSSTKSSTIKK